MNAPPTPTDLACRFTAIMAFLQKTIAARGGRDRVFALIVPLLWNYIGRAARRFEALAKRIEAGKAAPRPKAPRPQPSAPSEPRPRKPWPFPTGHGWLFRRARETVFSAEDLRQFFRDPAFAAFLDAAPQARRILNPLCEMLGILRDPDLPAALRPAPAPRRIRKPPAPDTTVTASARTASENSSPRYRPLARRYRLTFKPA